MRIVLLLLLVLATMLPGASAAAKMAEADLWALLRDGRGIAMIRHARAPGTGDPPGFRLEDCGTQRNLSAEGRAQAIALGEAFRENGIDPAAVLSSRWCRCLETARLAFGEVTPFPPLDSFFRSPETESVQTSALKGHLLSSAMDGTVVLVTHQVNITALTGIFPQEGEVIVLTADPQGGVQAVGRLFPVQAGVVRR